jgi:hypothetical protein
LKWRLENKKTEMIKRHKKEFSLWRIDPNNKNLDTYKT